MRKAMTTPTEKKYAKYVGKLYWSTSRESLVMITGLHKNFNRWLYQLTFLDTTVKNNPRLRDAVDIASHISQGRWMEASRWLELREQKP
jgi:hypothetical protein